MTRRPALAPVRALTALACALAALPSPGQTLAIDLVDSPAIGTDLNAAGDVLGLQSVYPCGRPGQCAPVLEPSVWRHGVRHVLPGQAGRRVAALALGADGSVVGTLTDDTSQYGATRWRFDGSQFVRQDLGLLPGTSQSVATGIDAQGRVVGYALTPYVNQKAFVWTESGGLVDLADAGFPNDRPMGISTGGRVLADGHSYLLDDVRSVQPLPPSPPGFRAPQGQALRINDRGDLGGFLADTSGQAYRFLHRYDAALGQWQRLSDSAHSPNQSNWGMGRLDAQGTLSATVLAGAVMARATDTAAQPIQPRLSAAYPQVTVLRAQAHAGNTVLAHAVIGRSSRLVKLVAVKPCSSGCMTVASLAMVGRFIDDPQAPGSCTDQARNKVRSTLSVVDAAGAPLAGVLVKARYLDDVALNQPVQGRTGADGRVVLRHEGPACVGAVALLVTSARLAGATLDRRQGTLSGYVIPLP